MLFEPREMMRAHSVEHVPFIAGSYR